MTAGFIPASVQRLWKLWNIRGFMIMSLTVQLVLALTAPLRPKTSNFVIVFIVWSAYFLADWTAIFAFGLISNAGCSKSPSYVVIPDDLLALWASFLLIHLGGPDTITAFSLEDNALWLRHLVGLIAQVFAFLYIFAKTLGDNELMATTILVFTAGVIKYGERTRALYLASLENFKESLITSPYEGENVEVVGVGQDEESSDKKLKRVFHFFQIFKGLIVDVTPNNSQRHESREFFLEQNSDSAFKIIATELNLLYEVFYTKIMAANSTWGVVIRSIAFYLSVAALISFCVNKKEGIHPTDIWITYALLAGVIALDSSSEIMLTSSDWSSNQSEYLGCQIIGRGLVPFLISVLLYTIVIIPLYVLGCDNVIERLWSDKMGSFNLVYCSFKEGLPRKGCTLNTCCRAFFSFITEKIGVAEAIAKFRYTSKYGMEKNIWKFTFDILKERASGANEPDKVREVFEARGELVLMDDSNDLKRYVTDFEYDQSVIFWHVATEICYNMDPNLDKNNENVRFSKIFSDYAIYLLVKQPDMMSAITGIFHKRYRDICSTLKQLQQRVRVETLEEFCSNVNNEYGNSLEPLEEFCSNVNNEYGNSLEPGNNNDDSGMSMLIDSCNLVRILGQTSGKWEVICKVWVELLSYAAGHCKVDSHARMLKEGGEFVTFVWLSMAHLGIGPHFPKN